MSRRCDNTKHADVVKCADGTPRDGVLVVVARAVGVAALYAACWRASCDTAWRRVREFNAAAEMSDMHIADREERVVIVPHCLLVLRGALAAAINTYIAR